MEINEIVSAIESLTLIQASELVKALEEKFWLASTLPRRSPSSRPSVRSCRAWA